MTRADLLHCITDRPCAVCRFNEDGNGCKKWNCVFDEKPENDTLDLDAWDDMINELIEFEEKCNKRNPDAVMWVHHAIGIVAKYDRLVKHPDEQMEHFKRLGEYYNGGKREVTTKQNVGYCKDCKHFEYDSVANVDGIPLIVAHEICNKWGNGCKTKEDGFCFLFEPKIKIKGVE